MNELLKEAQSDIETRIEDFKDLVKEAKNDVSSNDFESAIETFKEILSGDDELDSDLITKDDIKISIGENSILPSSFWDDVEAGENEYVNELFANGINDFIDNDVFVNLGDSYRPASLEDMKSALSDVIVLRRDRINSFINDNSNIYEDLDTDKLYDELKEVA